MIASNEGEDGLVALSGVLNDCGGVPDTDVVLNRGEGVLAVHGDLVELSSVTGVQRVRSSLGVEGHENKLVSSGTEFALRHVGESHLGIGQNSHSQRVLNPEFKNVTSIWTFAADFEHFLRKATSGHFIRAKGVHID